MARTCRNCGNKVYLDGFYCPYCKSEFEASSKGTIILIVLALTFIILAISTPLLMPRNPTLAPIMTLIVSIALFGVIIISAIVVYMAGRGLVSTGGYKKPSSIPDFSPRETILSEIKFLEMVPGGFIYNLFFTDNYIIFCYLDMRPIYPSPESLIPGNIVLNRRLRRKDEELDILKDDLVKLSSYSGNNFYIPLKEVEEVVFGKRSFQIRISSENRSLRARKIKFSTNLSAKLANQGRDYAMDLFRRFLPDKVREEKSLLDV